MTYYQLQGMLSSQGFKTYRERVICLTGIKTVSLHYDTPPIGMDQRVKTFEWLLEGKPVKITKFPNEAFIKLEIIKPERNVE